MADDNHPNGDLSLAPDASWQEAIGALRFVVRIIENVAVPPDDEVADFLGQIRAAEVRLATYRQGLVAETPAVEGAEYRIEETRRAKRTYSTWGIVLTYGDHRDSTALEAIRELVHQDVMRVSWHWTNLKNLFRDEGIELVVIRGEVTPDQVDVHVGEVWETKSGVKPKEEDA